MPFRLLGLQQVGPGYSHQQLSGDLQLPTPVASGVAVQSRQLVQRLVRVIGGQQQARPRQRDHGWDVGLEPQGVAVFQGLGLQPRDTFGGAGAIAFAQGDARLFHQAMHQGAILADIAEVTFLALQEPHGHGGRIL
ncbi:hypothetical protein D9M70_525000 [compost metagenome]